jgi:Flp pilus assembly protein protease CpaA
MHENLIIPLKELKSKIIRLFTLPTHFVKNNVETARRRMFRPLKRPKGIGVNRMHPLLWVPFVALMIIAAATDLRNRTIYDWMTVPGLVYFLAVHRLLGDLGWMELGAGVCGLGGLALLLAVLSGGRLGGGDIKLFAMLGAGLGWSAGIWVFLLTFLLAALVAWPMLLIRRWASHQGEWTKELPMAPFMAASAFLVAATADFI